MVLCSIIDVFKKIADKCVDPIVGYVTTEVGYLSNYKANIENLRAQVQNLNDATKSLKDRIEDARYRSGATQVDAVAQRWLERMTDLNEEASRIIRDEERETERCLMGLRPNLCACYLASKSARKVMDAAEELKKDGAKIDRVAHIDYSQCLGVATNPDFAELESRKKASEQIVGFLKDPSVKIVGMYGMGGSGKTTLAEKIGVQLYEDGTFKYVVLSVVSNQQKQDPVHHQKQMDGLIYAIQKQIADLLKIKLQETDGLKARAKQLREQLVLKDKLLIILDDIWHRLELRDVGIPVDSSSPQELKVLITSRDLNVMNDMNSKHNVPLDILTTDDAWTLFDRMADGVAQEDSVLHSTAKDVVKQCGGIPVLLVTIARALRNKGLETWKEALLQLEKFDGDKFVEDGYKRLEVSYNFLPDDEIKSLFLLCAQLVHHSIPIQDLLRYTMGLGFFKGRGKLKEVSPRLHMHLDALKGYCLLQDGKTKGTVRMHDVVYKFAVFVASRDHHTFIVSDELPPAEQLEQLTAISLPYCDQIPAVLFDTPNLESFLMYPGEKYQPNLRIPDNFFKQMTRLKLLVSRRMCLSQLPTSLKDLQTLCLDDCELDDIAMIGELRMLQVLSLKGSNVAHLPTEIGNLDRLKVLDLSECDDLEVIAPGVLSKLTLLEDLRIENKYNNVWEQEGCSSNGTETASLEELRKLQNLSNLQIDIDDGKMYPKDLIFVNLETFRIGIKCRAPTLFRSSKSLGLDLDNARADQLDQGIKVLMARAENLSLENITGFTSLCELINLESFPHLKHLDVTDIAEIPYIAQPSSCVVFPKLESLVLRRLEKLEMICVAQPFKNLSILRVDNCHRLKDLFSSHLERGFMCLTELSVWSCKGMQTIVSRKSENRSVDDQDQDDKDIEFTQLRSLTLENLPSLTSFYCNLEPTVCFPENYEESDEESYEGPTPAFLLNKKIMFPRLERLYLTWMRADKIWEGQLAVESFQSLTSLKVMSCHKLSFLFSSLMVGNLGQLKRLTVWDCDSVEEIVAVGGEEMTEEKLLVFPKLEYLRLWSLKKLKKFCHVNLLKYPSLKELRVRNCNELMTFITNDANPGHLETISSSILFDEKVVFPNLEKLTLEKVDQLKMIWGNELHPDSLSKLKTLYIRSCASLESVFPAYLSLALQQLEVLHVESCERMRGIVSWKEAEAIDCSPGFLFSKLKYLRLEDLPRLERFYLGPDTHISDWPCLKRFTLLNCHKIDMQQDGTFAKVVFPNLEELTLIKVDQLKMIWGNELHPDSLSKLKNLEIRRCASLESVFPAYLSLALQQFERLKLGSCERMRGIVSWKEAEAIDFSPGFLFSKLNFLELDDLPGLEKFYLGPDIHISDWPCLKKLVIHNCQKTDLQQDDGTFAKIIPILDYYHFVRGDLSVKYENSDGGLYIRYPELFSGGSHVFPVALLQGFQHLKKLEVKGSNLEQVLFRSDLQLVNPGDDEDTVAKILARIQSLELAGLREMTYIWSEHSPLDQILHNLKSLYVKECDSLISLVPSTALFQNLRDLKLYRCQKLMKLFSSSTARSLINLIEMTVRECESLTEIVGDIIDEDAIEDNNDIVFDNLKELKLVALRSLTSFCSAHNCSFKFPSLNSVTVEQCPNMVFFSPGILTAPKLTRVMEEENEEELWRWEGDLNSTIGQWHRELMV